MNVDSKFHKAYYKHILNQEKTQGNLGKVFDLIADVTNRRGFRPAFESFDTDVQEKIVETWLSILSKPD